MALASAPKGPILIQVLPPHRPAFYLVGLGQLMKYPSIDGSGHEVVSSSDGVDVTREVEVKLQKSRSHRSLRLSNPQPRTTHTVSALTPVGAGWSAALGQAHEWASTGQANA